jgi:hypothetical protein
VRKVPRGWRRGRSSPGFGARRFRRASFSPRTPVADISGPRFAGQTASPRKQGMSARVKSPSRKGRARFSRCNERRRNRRGRLCDEKFRADAFPRFLTRFGAAGRPARPRSGENDALFAVRCRFSRRNDLRRPRRGSDPLRNGRRGNFRRNFTVQSALAEIGERFSRVESSARMIPGVLQSPVGEAGASPPAFFRRRAGGRRARSSSAALS